MYIFWIITLQAWNLVYIFFILAYGLLLPFLLAACEFLFVSYDHSKLLSSKASICWKMSTIFRSSTQSSSIFVPKQLFKNALLI